MSCVLLAASRYQFIIFSWPSILPNLCLQVPGPAFAKPDGDPEPEEAVPTDQPPSEQQQQPQQPQQGETRWDEEKRNVDLTYSPGCYQSHTPGSVWSRKLLEFCCTWWDVSWFCLANGLNKRKQLKLQLDLDAPMLWLLLTRVPMSHLLLTHCCRRCTKMQAPPFILSMCLQGWGAWGFAWCPVLCVPFICCCGFLGVNFHIQCSGFCMPGKIDQKLLMSLQGYRLAFMIHSSNRFLIVSMMPRAFAVGNVCAYWNALLKCFLWT